MLTEGKLTSLEEFRIQKDLFENQIKEAHDSLKRKDEELPMHLERMERQTVLRIETLARLLYAIYFDFGS
jgi:hypothetical protein